MEYEGGRHGLTKAQALEGKDVKDMLLNVGSGGGAAAAPSGGAAGGAAGGAPAEAKEEEKKEEGMLATPYRRRLADAVGLTVSSTAKEDESDEDMGFGLFD